MKWQLQSLNNSCGPATIKNLLMLYGVNIKETTLIKRMGLKKIDGTPEEKIYQILDYYNIKYKKKKIYKSWDKFYDIIIKCLKQSKPILLYTECEGHIVLLSSVINEKIQVINSGLDKSHLSTLITEDNIKKLAYSINTYSFQIYYTAIFIETPTSLLDQVE